VGMAQGGVDLGLALDGLDGLRRKCVRQRLQKGPGLKPLEFAGFFVGLKPHANPKKQPQRLFQQPVSALADHMSLFPRASPRLVWDAPLALKELRIESNQ